MHSRARIRARALKGTAVLAAALALTSALAAGPATADPEPTPTETTETTQASPPTEASEATEPPAVSTPPTETPAEPTETMDPTIPGPPPGQEAELDASVTFDKASYRTGEDVRATVTIRNSGSTGTGLISASINTWDSPDAFVPSGAIDWGVFGFPGVVLAPGETRSVELTGRPKRLASTSVVFSLMITEGYLTKFPTKSFSAPVEPRTGSATGLAYGDRNGNGAPDPGEGLAGEVVELRALGYDYDYTTFRTTTDAGGRFDFGDVPTTSYHMSGIWVDNFNIPYRTITVDTKGSAENLMLRGSLPYNGALSATMEFTKDSYQPGELAHLTVTLTNSGTKPFTNLRAFCNHIGDDWALWGTGPGWGELATGLTLAPGETRVLDVTETVPAIAQLVGYVYAACDFGLSMGDYDDHAMTADEAFVPGGVASFRGRIDTGKDMQGMAGVRVILANPDLPCPMAAEATTDANGEFVFRNLMPSPYYLVYVVPPAGMKTVYDNPSRARIEVEPGDHLRWSMSLEQGEAELPELPELTSGCPGGDPVAQAPAAQGRSDSGLASTGASVIGLGALGLLTLIGGTAALVIARRRRTAA
ncbi:hypothetical protein [Actinophytocola sp.]|uniref:hypothetical protein n=1 Tax=Actinophytocola sp. TaxID=1872138 RepID=UPI002D7FE569|nr:hypothetical protein [Actinophytocola sp.]HET9142930.1 hypothetical protein [Actinophytocola sp.]